VPIDWIKITVVVVVVVVVDNVYSAENVISCIE
jgi:hypothetical protein